MYKGDGSYSVDGRAPQISLLDLINREDQVVSKLNESFNALEVAKRSGLRTGEYVRMIEDYTEQLKTIRAEIATYLSTNIGVKTDIIDKLYTQNQSIEQNNTVATVNLSRRRRRT